MSLQLRTGRLGFNSLRKTKGEKEEVEVEEEDWRVGHRGRAQALSLIWSREKKNTEKEDSFKSVSNLHSISITVELIDRSPTACWEYRACWTWIAMHQNHFLA